MSAVKEITLKYLKLSSSPKSVVAMTFISILGIMVGVATLVITVSIANGFAQAYKESILNFNAHVILYSMESAKENAERSRQIRQIEGVELVTPFLYREGLVIFKGNTRGASLKGVELEKIRQFYGMDIISFQDDGKNDLPGVYVGSAMAYELNITKGDNIRYMLPGDWGESGVENFRTLKVKGFFESGMYDFDSQFILLSLNDAQSIVGKSDMINGYEIKLADSDKAEKVASILNGKFAYPFYATHWKEMNRSLFEAIKLERLMFILIMGALVVVAAFNVIGTVMLRMLYKTSDVSILRALGMRLSKIKKVFVLQGLFVGIVGTLAGLIISLIILYILKYSGWVTIPQEVYLIKRLPICISWIACVSISSFSVFISWVTSEIATQRLFSLPLMKGLHRP